MGRTVYMDALFKAMNIAYNTFVESPPRVLHEENVPKFTRFSTDLFESLRWVGLDLDKHRPAFDKELRYYMKFVEQLRAR